MEDDHILASQLRASTAYPALAHQTPKPLMYRCLRMLAARASGFQLLGLLCLVAARIAIQARQILARGCKHLMRHLEK